MGTLYEMYVGLNRTVDGRSLDIVGFNTDITSYKGRPETHSLHFKGQDPYKPFLLDGMKEAIEMGKTVIFIEDTAAISCRESLLWRIKTVLDATKVLYSMYGKPFVYIYFNARDDNYEKAILEFGSRYFVGLNNKFSIQKHGTKLALVFRFPYSDAARDLWLLSLFLYMARDLNCLNDILRDVPEGGGLDSVLDYLSKAYLTNTTWQMDSSNSPLALSMFCFLVKKKIHIQREWSNGPASATIYGISPFGMIAYLEQFHTLLDGKNLGRLVTSELGDNFMYAFRMMLGAIKEIHKEPPAKKPVKVIYDLDGVVEVG